MKSMIKRTVMGTAIALAAMGANAADLYLSPDAGVDLTNILVGSEFNLTLGGTGFASGVDSLQMQISWDASVLAVASSVVEINNTGEANGFNLPLTVPADLDQVAGTLDVALSTFFTPPVANGDFFTVAFLAIAAPFTSSVISVKTVGFSDPNNQPYDVNYDNAYVTVQTNEVPLPAAVWLFGTGLLGLAGIARRRNQPEAAAA